jgi:hypothetical protein
MCSLCDDNNGEYLSCVDCSRLICFDAKPDSVDVLDRAYVTASGDLYCRNCGMEMDRAEQKEEQDEVEAFYEPPPFTESDET